jgi:hypothetical protein
MKRCYLVALLTLLAPTAVASLESLERGNREGIVVDVPQSEVLTKWHCGHQQTVLSGDSISEWVPRGQDVYTRKELITIQFIAGFPGIPAASEFVDKMHSLSQARYSDMTWKVLERSDNDVLYEWSLPSGHQGVPPQHEIVRVISTDAGIHRVAYEKSVPELDDETRELWLSRLRTSHLAN